MSNQDESQGGVSTGFPLKGAASESPTPKSLEAFHAREFMNQALINAASIESALPYGFTNWDLRVYPPGDDDGWETVGHIAAAANTFPVDFPWWDLENAFGYSIAHVAASQGRLPRGFGRWNLDGPGGFTVAHALVASGYGHPDFDAWDLKDDFGTTPAHIAACVDMPFPNNFDDWELEDGGGCSVASLMVAYGHSQADEVRGLVSDQSPCLNRADEDEAIFAVPPKTTFTPVM